MSALMYRRWVLAGVAFAAVLAVAAVWWCLRGGAPDHRPYPPPLGFDGPSDRLKQTVVVPTLSTPVPEGRSAIWCASFQLAWNRLRDDVARGPVRLSNGQPVADLLNGAGSKETDLPADAVYAAAGLVRDGVVGHIQREMARRFPDVARPAFDVPPEGAVAYAYLAASARFDLPYFENDRPLLFTDAAGKKTPVGSFGIRKKEEYAHYRLRDQVQVLYCPRDAIMSEREIPEFIIDPCKASRPYQIVLARVDRKPTLEATLADIDGKIATQPADRYATHMHPRDTLLVPNIALNVSHRFKELEGTDRRFENPALRGLYLDTALQTVRFRLDRGGAELASEAKMYMKPGASFFDFNRPFLVYMKQRGGERPFLVIWVDNAELLEKR